MLLNFFLKNKSMLIQNHVLISSFCSQIYICKFEMNLNSFIQHSCTEERVKCLWCVCAQLCPTLWEPLDCRLPVSSVHEIFQARILEWVAISFFRGIFPTQGLSLCLLRLLHWQADSSTASPPIYGKCCQFMLSIQLILTTLT